MLVPTLISILFPYTTLFRSSVRIGQGRENSKNFLKENSEMCDRLEKAIRSRTDKVAEEMMAGPEDDDVRSEEHTSELQSHSDLVCRLLLEKKTSQKKSSYIH